MLPTVAAPEVGSSDFQGIAASFVGKFSGPSDPENPSMTKEIWTGFWEDVLGPKDQGRPKA